MKKYIILLLIVCPILGRSSDTLVGNIKNKEMLQNTPARFYYFENDHRIKKQMLNNKNELLEYALNYYWSLDVNGRSNVLTLYLYDNNIGDIIKLVDEEINKINAIDKNHINVRPENVYVVNSIFNKIILLKYHDKGLMLNKLTTLIENKNNDLDVYYIISGFLEDDKYIDKICRIIKSNKNPYMRSWATRALGCIGDVNRAAPVLKKYVFEDVFYEKGRKGHPEERNYVVVQAGYKALKKLGLQRDKNGELILKDK